MARKILVFFQALYYFFYSSLKLYRAKKSAIDDVVYITRKGVQINVYPGKKKQSPYDFIVKFKEPGKRERTPKHVHLIVEMYVKYAYNNDLTLQLKEHILTMLNTIKPINKFPPEIQFFQYEHVPRFKELDKVGEFTVEFLLAVIELTAIQEKTNYPKGSLTDTLYKDLFVKDRFSVIQKAVWRNK